MLTQLTTVAATAQGRLPAQFKTKARFLALVAAHGAQHQALEDALFSIINGQPYPVAQGDALTRWGKAVGEPRPTSGTAATDDTVYRPTVQARIITNTSNGRAEDVLSILRALGATDVQYAEPAPASIFVEEQGDLAASDAELVAFLTTATGPVNIHATEYTSHPFGFAADPTAFGFDDGELGRTIA